MFLVVSIVQVLLLNLSIRKLSLIQINVEKLDLKNASLQNERLFMHIRSGRKQIYTRETHRYAHVQVLHYKDKNQLL